MRTSFTWLPKTSFKTSVKEENKKKRKLLGFPLHSANLDGRAVSGVLMDPT